MKQQDLVDAVWGYYASAARDLPWRQAEADGAFDPYKILLSEVMLQQTQVSRVIPKYHQFLAVFPTIQAVAQAPLADVLKLWSGLGYNRRAKFLWQAAQQIVREYNGIFPADQTALTSLPGIGNNTAGAICAYAFNMPVTFIETNIRTVFIHHLFSDSHNISDAMLTQPITDCLQLALQNGDARNWYWALMDYGSYLKSTVGNIARHSKHYAKQSTFEGSRRQIRGHILRLLAERPLSPEDLQGSIADPRLPEVLAALMVEGLIHSTGGIYFLGG